MGHIFTLECITPPPCCSGADYVQSFKWKWTEYVSFSLILLLAVCCKWYLASLLKSHMYNLWSLNVLTGICVRRSNIMNEKWLRFVDLFKNKLSHFRHLYTVPIFRGSEVAAEPMVLLSGEWPGSSQWIREQPGVQYLAQRYIGMQTGAAMYRSLVDYLLYLLIYSCP